jgi:hypothetical protein
MIPFAPSGNGAADFLIERHTADGILLFENKVSHAGGDRATVLVFVEWTVAVLHALGNIDGEMTTQVGVFVKLLDNQSVLARPDFPINMAQVVTGDIFPVLSEFNRLTEIGTAVHTR